MPIQDTGTELVLIGIGMPFYSARGLKQVLTPIQSLQNNRNNIRRTVGFSLVNMTPAYALKYYTKISADDIEGPAWDGVFPGFHPVTVWCAAELGYPSGGSPQRPVVSGSSRVESGAPFTFYRPILQMMVLAYDFEFDEWGARRNWSMELEEM